MLGGEVVLGRVVDVEEVGCPFSGQKLKNIAG
jgi:hypothetical protein